MRTTRSRIAGCVVAAACAIGAIPPATAAPSGAHTEASQLCNGQWQPAPTAGLPKSFSGYDVKVFGANKLVLAGRTGPPDDTKSAVATWDGSRWKTVNLPGQFVGNVAGVSPKDLFAVSIGDDGATTWHFDGRRWLKLPSPKAFGDGMGINAIVSDKAGDLWAAGALFTDLPGATPVVAHYAGGTWHTIATNLANTPWSVALDLRFSPKGELWLTGEDVSSNADYSIIRKPYAGKLVGNRFRRGRVADGAGPGLDHAVQPVVAGKQARGERHDRQ